MTYATEDQTGHPQDIGSTPSVQPPEQVRVVPRMVQPTVTYVIMAVTILIYVVQEAVKAGIFRAPFLTLAQSVLGTQLLNTLVQSGQADDLLLLIGGRITPLIQMGQVWRLLTPALLHLSIMHIAGNMYSLFVLGPTLESNYGHKRFLALYVLSALGGNIMSMFLTRGISAGASTAIFGLIAAEGVFIYMNRKMFGANARRMLSNVVTVVLINLVLGISLGFDNWGHLGGLLTGAAFSWLAGPQLGVVFNGQNYVLIDRRSRLVVWAAGIGLTLVLLALVAVKMFQPA
jgi:rhomboid protease GluP